MKIVRPGVTEDELVRLASRIDLLLMDCDGVLTDGRLYFGPGGEALKVFNVQDGQGIASWHAVGGESGIISGRDAGEIVRRRAGELGMRFVVVSSRDKYSDLGRILEAGGFDPTRTAFVGDDLGDIPVLRNVGLPIAVANAVAELDRSVIAKTERPGGNGAVREVTDFLISARHGN